MKQLKQRMRQAGMLMLMLIMVVTFSVQTVSASDEYDSYGVTKHIGKYYFKYNYDKERLYISKKAKKGFKKTIVDSQYYASNGKKVLYVKQSGSRYYIRSYDIAKKKSKKIKKLPNTGYWKVVGVEGEYIWLDGLEYLYKYKISTKKLKKTKVKISSVERLADSYYLFTLDSGDDFKDVECVNGTTAYLFKYKTAIYQIKSNGKLKRIKSLGKVTSSAYEGTNKKTSKVYYAASNSHKLYRINANGKKKKCIFTTKGYITYVFDNCCYFIKNGMEYKYNYKSKKIHNTTNDEL